MSLPDRRAQGSELLRSGGCNEIEAARLDGFYVAWLTAEGRKRGAALRMVAEELFEEALPCRRFPAYRGQRYFPGHYWLATTGRHVGYESLLERAHLTLLDFDLDVVAVAAQPFVLQWPEGRRLAQHIPDFFVRHADGRASVVDVKPRARVSERDRVVFAAVREACAEVGWSHRVRHEPAALLLRNVEWLAGYRRQVCDNPRIARVLLGACYSPTPLGEVAAAYPVAEQARPVLFHLLWRQRIACDLSMRLSDASLLTAVSAT
jgi:hypothetical protein